MKPIAMRLDDLNPDGIVIRVNWDNMDVGSSAFIPCLDTEKARSQLKSVADQKLWEIDTQICVEGSRLGVRVWRTA